jgi:Putative zinc-finger
MADQLMSTTMGNPECEWVHVRLPLWVSVSDGPTERNGEGGDLSPDDRRSIERHLGSCPACSEHRAGLERALEALGLAAGSLPAAPEAPSLWPALERRIAAHQARNRPRWLRVVHGVSERGLRAWAVFDNERPLRLAWMRDSVGEALNVKGAGRSEPRARGREAQRRWVQRRVWVTGTGVAAGLLALAIGLPAAHRQIGSAQSIIQANAQGLPDAVVPPMPIETEATAMANPANESGVPPSDLAQADPISVSPIPAAEPAPPPKPATAPTTATTNPSPAPFRWNYDLEHGTPMPPYARDAKPVY